MLLNRIHKIERGNAHTQKREKKYFQDRINKLDNISTRQKPAIYKNMA